MSKVILNLATTKDGFIARKDNSVDFLPPMDENKLLLEEFIKFMNDIDIIVMGYNTYVVTKELGNGTMPFEDKKIYVCTYDLNITVDRENIFFTKLDVVDLANKMKNESKKNIWLFGGSLLIDSFLSNDLIDRFIITEVDVLIGEGIPLFIRDVNLKEINRVSEYGISTITYVKD